MFFYFAFALLLLDISEQCALPYWWTQQYHFQPDFPRIGTPKTSYRFRETIHVSDPNNYVRVQEYSEYTWWEHDTMKPKDPQLTPEDIRRMSNAVFTKGGPTNGFPFATIPRSNINGMFPRDNTNGIIPRKDATNGMIPRDNTNGIIPRKDATNGMIPRGSDTNGMMPKDDTNGMEPKDDMFPRDPDGMFPAFGIPGVNRNGDTNGMFPSDETPKVTIPNDGDANGLFPDTNGMVPEGDTNGILPTDEMPDMNRITSPLPDDDSTSSDERERNENEDIEVNKSGDIEENDLETSGASKASSELKVKEPKSTFFGSWFGKRNGNETGPCKVPETDIHSLRSMIEKMFSSPREHMINPESKEKAREDIMNKFRNFGLQVWTQNFTTPQMKGMNGTEESNEGVNLIGVIPGLQRGRLDDEIVLVGAHYDTVQDSNGVDDNGSGLAVMLEVARAITEARCRLNNTLMFVAFDHEENGAMGSNYFVDHYLIPEELKRARARFQGAFILDGIMNYNDIPNTQELPADYAESLPGFQYFVNNTGNRGNFLAMISRNEMDNHLSRKLMDAWKELGDNQYKLFNLAVDMGNTIPEPSIIQKHLNFLRSDHATFWYHNSSSHFPESLNAVLLTDTGPFRGQMKECYHSKCDDLTVITPEKLQFAKKTADALTATLVELTSATGAGNRVDPSSLVFALHIMIVYFITKALRNM